MQSRSNRSKFSAFSLFVLLYRHQQDLRCNFHPYLLEDMDVIKEIRRKKGYDEEMMRNADPHMVEWLTDTRANLHRSIEK